MLTIILFTAIIIGTSMYFKNLRNICVLEIMLLIIMGISIFVFQKNSLEEVAVNETLIADMPEEELQDILVNDATEIHYNASEDESFVLQTTIQTQKAWRWFVLFPNKKTHYYVFINE